MLKTTSRHIKKYRLSIFNESSFCLYIEFNISRYISTAKPEKKIDLKDVNENLKDIQKDIEKYTDEHNKFLQELDLGSIL